MLGFCVVCYICLFAGLNSFGLVGPDEPRYASIARAMAETGDWVTPRLNGAPWLEKPPLYYWTAAIGFRVFSSPEVAARIPSSIFALATILGVLWLARRIYGPPVAYLAGWMLPTTVGILAFAHAAAPDMPFAACLTLAMVAATVLLFDDSPPYPLMWAAGFGAALGLAVLAKGPAAIALAGGSTALWAIASGNLRRGFRLCHPAAIATFLVVALPWYVLCAARNPEFLRVFLLEHNVERFLTNRYQHHQPLWFFVPILLIAMFPWTLLLVSTLRDGWRQSQSAGWRHGPGLFFIAWAVWPFIFFTLSQSKLPGYILPAIPPLLVLLAKAVFSRFESGPGPARTVRLLLAIALVATGAAAFGVYHFRPSLLPAELSTDSSSGHLALSIYLGLASAAVAYGIDPFQLALRPHRAPRLGQSLVLYTCMVAASYAFLNVVDAQISPRVVAAQVPDLHGVSAGGATYHVSRAWQYGLDFYLHGPVPEWTPGAPRPAWIITDDSGRAQLAAQGWSLEAIEPGSPHARLYRVKNTSP